MVDPVKKRKFKIKIRCIADWYEEDIKVGKTFTQAVNDWWINVGKPSLDAELKNPVKYRSSLRNFIFEDDADDKEAYD